jgi:hypothetical protein
MPDPNVGRWQLGGCLGAALFGLAFWWGIGRAVMAALGGG